MKFRYTAALLLFILASLSHGVRAAAPHSRRPGSAEQCGSLQLSGADLHRDLLGRQQHGRDQFHRRAQDGRPTRHRLHPRRLRHTPDVVGTGENVFFTDTGLPPIPSTTTASRPSPPTAPPPTTPTPPPAPPPPSRRSTDGVAAVAGTDSSITLTWTDNANHATYFRIYRKGRGRRSTTSPTATTTLPAIPARANPDLHRHRPGTPAHLLVLRHRRKRRGRERPLQPRPRRRPAR